MSNQILGAYTTFTCKMDDAANQAWKEAMVIVGVNYQPVAVASQQVAGTNYAFFCNATVVAPDAPTWPAMVMIFKPLDGKPACITRIERISL